LRRPFRRLAGIACGGAESRKRYQKPEKSALSVSIRKNKMTKSLGVNKGKTPYFGFFEPKMADLT